MIKKMGEKQTVQHIGSKPENNQSTSKIVHVK